MTHGRGVREVGGDGGRPRGESGQGPAVQDGHSWRRPRRWVCFGPERRGDPEEKDQTEGVPEGARKFALPWVEGIGWGGRRVRRAEEQEPERSRPSAGGVLDAREDGTVRIVVAEDGTALINLHAVADGGQGRLSSDLRA